MKENKKKLGKNTEVELDEAQVGNVSGGGLGSALTTMGQKLSGVKSAATARLDTVKTAGLNLVDAAKGTPDNTVVGTATPAGQGGSDVYGLGSLFDEG